MQRALVSKGGVVAEVALPLVGKAAAIRKHRERSDWVATLGSDGKPDYIWGNDYDAALAYCAGMAK